MSRAAKRHPYVRLSCAAVVASMGAIAAPAALGATDASTTAAAGGVEVLLPQAAPDSAGFVEAPPRAVGDAAGYTFRYGGAAVVTAADVHSVADAVGQKASGETLVRDVDLFG